MWSTEEADEWAADLQLRSLRKVMAMKGCCPGTNHEVLNEIKIKNIKK